jgi:hypothetical protein
MRRSHLLHRLAFSACLLFSAPAVFALEQSFPIEPDAEHEELIATPNASTGSCGVERWSVKTGTDADVGLVDLNHVVPQTISYLRGLTAPANPPANNRVQPTETTTFVVDATLVEYKLENDSDYHLVIADAQGNTMIAEIPDPACVGSGSPFASAIQSARQQFDATYTATTSFQTANVPVQLTGVGFFDFQHGQTGVAPNAIELHPVLGIVFNPGSGNPDFALSANPGNVSVTQGSSATTTIAVTPQNGFAGSVAFSVSGLPSGVTAAFNPASSTSSSVLTFSAGLNAPAGTSVVTVTGTSGSLSHSLALNLTVSVAGGGAQTAVYNSTLKAPACATVGSSCDSGPTLLLGRGTLSGGAEPNQPNTINNSCADGNSGTFHSDESNDRIVIASTDGGPLTAGKQARLTATVWVYSTSADKLDLYSAANANSPSWTFLNTITPAATGAQTLSTTFTLPSGGLQAVRAHFRYQGSATPCSTGAYDESDDLVFAVNSTAPAPDFSLSATPTALTTTQGGSAASTISIGSLNGFSAATNLSVAGLPSGVSAAFSSNPVTPAAGGSATTTLTFTAAAGAATGTATVTVTASSGSLTHTTTLSLTVNPAGGATQLLGNPGFESGAAAPWSMSTGVLCSNASCSGETAHAGSWFVWLDGYGATTTDTLAQTVAIPAGKTKATLSYYLHIDTAETSTSTAYDTLTVQVLNGSGTVLKTLATYSNLNAAAGYAQHTSDVSAYIGQTVTIKFTGKEDASLQTSFVLDDITLTVQ